MPVRRRRTFEVSLPKEPDPGATGHRGPKLLVRDDLELLRLLVCRSMEGCCAQDPYVVRLAVELHQLIDEPAWGRRAGLAVLDRHDDAEAAARDGEPPLVYQPPDGLLQRLVGNPERCERLLTREDVAAGRLI